MRMGKKNKKVNNTKERIGKKKKEKEKENDLGLVSTVHDYCTRNLIA
jgi:hypothetical protein